MSLAHPTGPSLECDWENALIRLLRSNNHQLFRWTEHQGRELLLIQHPRCEAVFSRTGGQLLHFRPRGERSLLWCATRWPKVGAIRGGVPVCWPWFGRHPVERGLPHHGWARLTDWQLIKKQADSQGVQLHWCLELHDWRVELKAVLGDELHLQLITSHRDSEPCLLSHALHAYWRVADVLEVTLDGLDGAQVHDLFTQEAFTQQGTVRIVNEHHRAYRQGAVMHLGDPVWQRRLCIDGASNMNTVVWHPGSMPLSDVSRVEGREFLCVEAARCLEDSLVLAPGQEARLELRARVD